MFSSFKGSFATFHGRVPIVSWFPQSWGYPNSWMFFHGKILLKWRFGGSAHLQKPYIMVKNVGFYGYNLRCHQPNNRGLTWGPQKKCFLVFCGMAHRILSTMEPTRCVARFCSPCLQDGFLLRIHPSGSVGQRDLK